MNILVTGGAGFIGSHLVERLLHSNHRVTALDNLDPFYAPAIKRASLALAATTGQERFRFLETDLVNRDALERICDTSGFDLIIHLAAKAGVRASLVDPAGCLRTNVEGTANLLHAGHKAGCRRWVLASSSSVYGVNSKIPFAESDPVFTTISPYAASKLACEALGHAFHHTHGSHVYVLRFFTVYGPRQRPDLAIHKFAALIDAGHPIPVYGDGSTRRDYTYITDIVDGILRAAERVNGFEIINLGGVGTVRLDRLIAQLESALGKRAPLQYHPPQPGDVPITHADISKARALLDYNPSTSIAEGLPLFVAWFNSHKHAIAPAVSP